MYGLEQKDIDHVLDYTTQSWQALDDARLFITGGTGFVGKWLLETMLYANHRYGLGIRATILTRDVARFKRIYPFIADNSAIDLLEGDVRSFSYPAGSYSHIIHAASDMTPRLPPAHTMEVIVAGTRRVLDFAVDRSIADLLMISSGAVYGKQPATLSHIPETYCGIPVTPYGEAKLAAEELITNYAKRYGIAWRTARLFAVAGPYLPLDANYAAGNFVHDLVSGGPIRIGGDGTALRSYLYAGDMAIWLWTILTQGALGTHYNVGSEQAISIGDLALTIAGFATPACQVSLAVQPRPEAIPERYLPSTGLAMTTLGLKERISLEDGLGRMIAWNRSRLYETATA